MKWGGGGGGGGGQRVHVWQLVHKQGYSVDSHASRIYVMKIRFLVMHCSLKSKTMNKLKRARGKQQVTPAVY